MKKRKARYPHLTARKVWFLNKDLVTVYHNSGPAGIVTIKNYTKDRLETMTMKDFKRYRKRAYTIVEAAELLNKEAGYIGRKAREGWWPVPVGRGPNGLQIGTGPGYYSEEHLYEMRDIMALIHHGRPRKDGFISNNKTPTESQLRAAINDQMFVYVKDKDGNFIQTFDTFDGR